MGKWSYKQIELYNGKAFGYEVSNYGKKHGYLDYRSLAKIVGGMILANSLYSETYPEDWDLISGSDHHWLTHSGEECEPWDEDACDIVYHDIYQYYLISEQGMQFLTSYTDEIVYYHREFDLYLWGITHYGTSWDYVLTDIEIKGETK